MTNDRSVLYPMSMVVICLVIAIFVCSCGSSRYHHNEESITVTTTTTEEPCTTTTTTKKTTTTTVTTTTEETTTTTTIDMKDSLTYLGSFTGTYFTGDGYPCNGGSGRILIDCGIKPDNLKGSVASKFVYENYGYNHNGRTTIYITCDAIPSMDGWYFVDDYNADSSIIDFYYSNTSNCIFEYDGIINVNAWIG